MMNDVALPSFTGRGETPESGERAARAGGVVAAERRIQAQAQGV